METSGKCEAAVTASTRIGWVNFGECGELLLGKRLLVIAWKKDIVELLQSRVISSRTFSSDTHREKIVRNQETKMQVLCIKRKKEKKKKKKKKGGGKALIGQSDQLFRRVNQR